MNERMKSAIAGVLVAALVFAGGFFVGGLSGPVGQAQQMGTSHVTSDVEFGVDGTGVDVTFYSGTSSDYALWDASDVALEITGTDGQDALAVSDGNVSITDDLDVDGTANLDATDIDGAVDMASTLAVGGDITMENDETLSNSTDGVVQAGGNLAFSEGTAITCTNDVTFTVAGSFQPLVSASALTGTLIADGSVAGQIVVLTNENGSDNIVIAESGSNLAAGGDIQLDGGNDDAVMLLWTGDEWIKVAAFGDN